LLYCYIVILLYCYIVIAKSINCRSFNCLRRRSAAARLLGLRVRIPPGAWMPVCCECRVLSGRGLCDELIPRPEESYRLCCDVVCDRESSMMGRHWPTGGCWGHGKKYNFITISVNQKLKAKNKNMKKKKERKKERKK